LLKVKDLSVKFKVGDGDITAVDSISFEVPKKTVVGLVGESGSGKSVTALSILDLLPSTAKTNGQIFWKDQLVSEFDREKKRLLRGREISLIYQNPLAALNPVFTIGNQLIETIRLHKNCSKKEAESKAIDLLTSVNIPDASYRMVDYPHQFSLGMCQRIMIAIPNKIK